MKTNWAKKTRLGLFALLLVGAGISFVGCADEYAAYPGYRGGYYAGYSGYRPYYGGYGYSPYRSYGPYYGSPYYGAPYYGGAVVVSRTYTSRNGYYRRHNRSDRTRSSRNVNRRVQTRTSPAVQSTNDDERRYYAPR